MSSATADTIAPGSIPSRVRQFWSLTKPRVVQLITFCALIGMMMAVPGLPDWRRFLSAAVGIWLVAAAAAAFNCLVERHIHARMKRTAWRPTASGELGPRQAFAFSALLCAAGCALLWLEVNALTMWLTLAAFVGYAIVYTVVLKPLTPQNIVIGGASGAMPPLLGWAAMRDDVAVPAMLVWPIIFLWTRLHRLEALRCQLRMAMEAHVRELASQQKPPPGAPRSLGQRLLEQVGRLPIIRAALAIRSLRRG